MTANEHIKYAEGLLDGVIKLPPEIAVHKALLSSAHAQCATYRLIEMTLISGDGAMIADSVGHIRAEVMRP